MDAYEKARERYQKLKRRYQTNPSAVLAKAIETARHEFHRTRDELLRERATKDRG
jgi:hypothetical protein